MRRRTAAILTVAVLALGGGASPAAAHQDDWCGHTGHHEYRIPNVGIVWETFHYSYNSGGVHKHRVRVKDFARYQAYRTNNCGPALGPA